MTDSTREHLAVEVARWLVSVAGRDLVDAATGRLDAGASALDVGTWLRADGLDPAMAAAVMGAAISRGKARERWDLAESLLFTPAGLEQASDPVVSSWRARRFVAAEVEDRAAGLGGDTLALARTAASVTAIERDPARLVLLRHNTRVAGLDVRALQADVLSIPAPNGCPVHVDPARRVDGRRVRRLADYEPAVPALLDHLGEVVPGAGVAVVMSPAVDLADPGLPPDAELEFVQVGRDLVEAVAWTGALRSDDAVQATATLLDGTGAVIATRSRGQRRPSLRAGEVGDVLLEVASAAVRARLHDELGAEVGARRVAIGRALLTLDGEPPASPWWTARLVEAVLPARPKAVKRWLRAAEARPLELAVHGADVDVETFHRALGRPPRGPNGRRLELVRRDVGTVAIATLPVEATTG